MIDPETLTRMVALAVPGAPLVLLALLVAGSLRERQLSEQTISKLIASAILIGLFATLAMGVLMAARRTPHLTVEVGQWIVLPGYHFSVKLLFDSLSLPFVVLSYLLCGTIGGFASRYLHREPGFNRFFLLYAMFVVGMVTTALAGTIETLFAGWELVGLSSAMLVAFFHERPAPVRNGLRVWIVYRVSDAALLIAAVVLHHLHEGDFDELLGSGPWPQGTAALSASQALAVGLLLLIAAAGKSALIPFSGWLPRAMEGPTPSSAVFYGALSVHLGAYLLLRVGPLLEATPWLGAAVVLLGLSTAAVAACVARVQTDIKSALSFASLTQVGLIVAEIGLGLRWIPLAHMLGHACLRTLQFLRAPTLLQDYRQIENAIGGHLPRDAGYFWRFWPASARARLYRMALERGYLDAWLARYVSEPFLRVFRRFDSWERRWTDWLSRGESRESDLLRPGIEDELA